MNHTALLDEMVNAFLGWPLPESVCADGCATQQGPGRVGTNLLTAIEAKKMIEEVVLPLLNRELAKKEDRSVLLNIECGGHVIRLDTIGGVFRVSCNGGVRASFTIGGIGEVQALRDALHYLGRLELEALKNPKVPTFSCRLT